ncbi:MAG: hypothetical protein HQM12_23715 [SAR324 cluster bacterium]|nr:hypothetical protein [SAR324 cluster bacterium]
MIASMESEVIQAVAERKLPLTFPQQNSVKAGALFTYGFSVYELGKQASRLAIQILNGASPGDLPVESAEFQLTINLKTARQLGLEIPEYILRRAILIHEEE